MAQNDLHIFGIRHHGPGSARSLRAALHALKPDCLLIEGPPDADEILHLAAHEEMKPPAAILVYDPDAPLRSVYYPFAVFSPEWQAIKYGLKHKIPVRFMDLPQAHRLSAKEEDRPPEPQPQDQADPAPEPDAAQPYAPEPDPATQLRRDPLAALAHAAGYSDSERWWEHMVEHRRQDEHLFAAILEAMAALREKASDATEPDDLRREAYMRQTIRAAQKEGFGRIAVVCGAWHAPVLAEMPPGKEDAAALKGLPKVKVAATWVPWTYGRLTYWSGYGAGIESPGWYEHLWNCDGQIVERWMTRIARLFREQDLDCSSAHVIESVRLAETLAALRQRPLPGLAELNEAARSIFCFDSDAPMRLIGEKLIVSETLGEVPDETPAVPLQQDLQREQKRLRLPPEASERMLELDLRKPNDLDRSRVLHRLRLLGIPWGEVHQITGKGTFKEAWRLRWEPEFSVAVIEAAVWGNTVADAAANFARDAATKAADLPALTRLLDGVLLADLPDAIAHLMARIENEAAVAAEVNHLMDALPPLAQVLRYGNVRGTDNAAVAHVVGGLVARTCIGLPLATASLNDDAAGEVFGRILAVNSAISLIQNDEHAKTWHATLASLSDSETLHGLIAGRATRILLDAGKLTADESATRLGLALSPAIDPARSAAWIEGFLQGSGTLLLHDPTLWRVLDQWIANLKEDVFTQLLPLLRRTFSTFEKPERRMMGERVRQNAGAAAAPAARAGNELDAARADRVLPLIRQLLGV